MREIRVIIVYGRELVEISVEGEKLGISPIRKKGIHEWFQQSSGRDGWEGLIPEIKAMIDDDTAKLRFEFNGPAEKRYIFEQCLAERGLAESVSEMAKDELTKRNIEKAEKAEAWGDIEGAFFAYVDAADYGNSPEAQYCVAEYYYMVHKGETNKIETDKERAIFKALEYYEKAAEAGICEAKRRLYQLYYAGNDIKQNIAEALKWLCELAEAGDIQAKYDLAEHYLKKEDPSEADRKLAICLLEECAEHGHAEAQVRLANASIDGNVAKEDMLQTAEVLKTSAEQGDAEAQFRLGHCYEVGEGVEKIDREAVKWYFKAAKQGHAEAQYCLGYRYVNGTGIKQDYSHASKWFKQAAEQGHVEAQYWLGLCYALGLGMNENETQAAIWYQEAAKQGLAEAQYELGQCYQYGRGVKEDMTRAVEWYRKAAEQDETNAQYCLAMAYCNGDGVEADADQCTKWMCCAAEQDNPDAQYWLGEVLSVEGDGNEEAVEWFQKAAEQGHADAQYRLSLCYANGWGVEKDVERYVELLYLAADNVKPSENACMFIGDLYYDEMDFGSMVQLGAWALLSQSGKIRKLLRTEEGMEMMKYYQIAADLGNLDAIKKIETLRKYC